MAAPYSGLSLITSRYVWAVHRVRCRGIRWFIKNAQIYLYSIFLYGTHPLSAFDISNSTKGKGSCLLSLVVWRWCFRCWMLMHVALSRYCWLVVVVLALLTTKYVLGVSQRRYISSSVLILLGSRRPPSAHRQRASHKRHSTVENTTRTKLRRGLLCCYRLQQETRYD